MKTDRIRWIRAKGPSCCQICPFPFVLFIFNNTIGWVCEIGLGIQIIISIRMRYGYGEEDGGPYEASTVIFRAIWSPILLFSFVHRSFESIPLGLNLIISLHYLSKSSQGIQQPISSHKTIPYPLSLLQNPQQAVHQIKFQIKISPLINPINVPTPIVLYNQYFPMSTQQYILKCSKGKTAVTVCARPQCKQPSLMCTQQKCECRSPHTTCGLFSSVNDLKNNLIKKGVSYLPNIQATYKFFQNQRTLIEKVLKELEKMISNKEPFLGGKEQELYSYLIGNKEDYVSAALVKSVTDSIYRENEYEIEPKLKQINNRLATYDRQFKDIVGNVKGVLNNSILYPTLQTSGFSTELCHPNTVVLSKNIVRLNKYDGTYQAALIERQFLEGREYKGCSYRFKINKLTNTNFMIGMCQLTSNLNIKNPNIQSSMQNGIFNHSTNVYCGSIAGHRNESNYIKTFQTHDIVEIQYEKENEKVMVKNITKSTQSTSYIKTDPQSPLYVAVLLFNGADEVELTDVKYIE